MQATTYTVDAGVVWSICYGEQAPWMNCETDDQVVEDGSAQAAVSPAPAVSADSASPSSGVGPSQTFTLQYSSPAGASEVAQGWFWIDATGASAANSCVVVYDTPTHALWLLNDAATAWSSASVGAGPLLYTSQCARHLHPVDTPCPAGTLALWK
jgi:hypothetical protein